MAKRKMLMPTIFEKNLCKHLIGVSIRLNIALVPQEVRLNAVEIGQKRKRGRPCLAKKALIMQ